MAALPPIEPPAVFDPHAQPGAMAAEPMTWHPVASQAADAVWQALDYEGTRIVALATGAALPLIDKGASDDELRAAAVRFASDNAVTFGLAGCELSAAAVHRVRDGSVVTVRPALTGIPIYSGFVILSINRNGALALVKAQGFGAERSGRFNLSERTAVAKAAIAAECDESDYSVERYWLPQRNLTGERYLLPCYVVSFTPSDALRRPAVFVNADDGSIIAIENRVYYDQLNGQIDGLYKPLYARDDDARSPFPDEWLRLSGAGEQYTNDEGGFSFEVNQNQLPVTLTTELRGRWVNVDYDDGADARFQAQIGGLDPVVIIWDENRARDDERNLYYQVNFIHSFWKGLDPGFDAMDYPVSAVCQYGDHYDNAFWNGQGLYFGGGGEMGNFAMFADIIWHEYGHAVTSGIYSYDVLPYTGESGALNEAWSDYFPCSISDEPLMGEGGLVGGLAGGGYIRNLDNNLKYPRDITNEVHADSRIVSAAMWHSREVLGRERCDSLFHYARYQQGNNFLAFFTDVLLTDDDNGDISDGTPNYEALYEQFGRHGIGPGLFPNIKITRADLSDTPSGEIDGDGDRLWEPGETVGIDVEIRRDGVLYPPPARDVVMHLTTDHPDLEIVRSEVSFGDLAVGDDAVAAEPLLFRIAEDAPISFARLYLVVSRAEGDTLFLDTLRVPLGNPPVLLVRDGIGAGVDRTPWFEEALDSVGVVYEEFWTAAPNMPLADRLPQYPTLVWFTGDDRDGILVASARHELERYLDNGGRLLLTGQSLDRAPNADQFFANYLGAVHIADSLHGRYLFGVEGDPVSDGLRLLLLGFWGAQNNRRPSGLQAVGDGVEIYHWHDVDGNPAGAVRREDPETGARTIYLGFGLEAVGGHGPTAKRSVALGRMLNWLGVPNAAPIDSETPVGFTLAPAYPNPFNGAVNIPFRLALPGIVNLTVYDLAGRLVWERQGYLQAGASVWALPAADWASGEYLIRLALPGGAFNQRVVLVR